MNKVKGETKVPQVSIIMPVFNTKKEYLERAVECVRAQTLSDWELLLVDDGSEPECARQCDELGAADSRVRVLHKNNGGPSSARNAGVESARGDYIGFMDSDDVNQPEMYETMLRSAEDNEVCAVRCGLEICVYSAEGDKTTRFAASKFRDEVITGRQYRAHTFDDDFMFNSMAQLLLKKETAQKLKADEACRGAEDFYYNFQLSYLIDRVAIVPQLLYTYYAYEKSLSHNSSADYGIDSARVYLAAAKRVNSESDELGARRAYTRGLWMFLNNAFLQKKTHSNEEKFMRVKRDLRENGKWLLSSELCALDAFRCRLFLFSEPLYALSARLYRLVKGIRE